MACPYETVLSFPLQASRGCAGSGNEAGSITAGSRAAGDVEKAVEALDSDLGALVCEAKGGIIDLRTLGTIERHLRCLVHHIWEAQDVFHHLTCPVDWLPSDVLEQIFILAALQRIPDTHHSEDHHNIWVNSRIDMMTSYRMASVCRRWRNVALRCSALWNTIQCSPIANIHKQLAFTSPGPLELVVDSGVHALPAAVDTTRVQSLQWAFNDCPTPGDCEVSLDFYAPALETCVLSATSPARRSVGKRNLFFTPFGGHAPMLRRLTLYNLPYSVHLQLDSLTSLHLHNCLYQGNARGLHQMLASAPNLVDLVVSLDSQRRDGIVNWSRVPRAQLPHLRRLVFAQLSMAAIQRFLRLVEISALTAVRIVVPDSGSASETAMWHSRSAHAILRCIPAAHSACDAVVDSDGSVMAFGADAGVRVEGLRATPDASVLSAENLFACLARGPSIRTLWLLQRDRAASPIQRDDNTLALPWSVDRVVVYEASLPAVLRSLDKRRELPSSLELEGRPRRNLPSLHVLLEGSLSAEWALHQLGKYCSRDDGSGVDNVTIEYVPSYRGPRFTHAHQGLFYNNIRDLGLKIDFILSSEEPVVPLPEVCITPTHRLWPSWKVKLTSDEESEIVRSTKLPPAQVVTLAATQSQATIFPRNCMFPVGFMTPLLAGLRKAIQPPGCPWS